MKSIKKGEYVVVLFDPSRINNWGGYCFKQAQTQASTILPESTPKFMENLNGDYHENYLVNSSDWRYATSDEIREYDRIGHYFKVEELHHEITNYEIY